MHPNGRFCCRTVYPSSNAFITMAITCGHNVIVQLVRQLGTTHVQEAMKMAPYGGHAHVVQLWRNYDKVDIDEIMVLAPEGSYEDFVRLCRELGKTNLDSACYGLQVAVKKRHALVSRLECQQFQSTNGVGSIRWS